MANYNSFNSIEEKAAYIASEAALDVDGVGSLVPAPISSTIKYKEIVKGICISRLEELEFNIFLNVRYGVKIPQVCFAVQEAVKKAVEKQAALEVNKVHINIQGIDFN